MRGGIGTEGEMVFFGGGAEVVEHHSGLNARDAAGGIDLQDTRHVFGKIENYGDVTALAGKRCAAATAEKRSAKLTAERDGGDHVFDIAGKNNSDGDLPVVRAVGGVEGARARVEMDFAANVLSESAGQTGSVYYNRFCGAGEFSKAVWHAAGYCSWSRSVLLVGHVADLQFCFIALRLDIDGDDIVAVVGNDSAAARIRSGDDRVGKLCLVKAANFIDRV